MNPTAVTEFTTLTALFDEFRILKVEYHYQPNNRYSKVTVVTQPYAVGFDNDTSSVVSGGFDDVLARQQCVFGSLDDPLHFTAHRPMVTPSAYWVDCAVPAGSVGSIVRYSDNLTVSTNYGQQRINYFIEFRMRQ
jgi:hypothetical protein